MAVLAILFQLGFQLGAGLSSPAVASQSGNDFPPIIICSAAGGLIQLPGDADQEIPSHQDMTCIFCVVCQARTLGGNLLPVSQLYSTPPAQIDLDYDKDLQIVLNLLWQPDQRHPRAPPSLV